MAAETAITFGATAGFGTFTGWKLESDTPNTQSDRASALDDLGNEVASAVFNERTEYSSTYTCTANTNTVPATLGKLYNGRILTGIAIATSNTGAATMTLTGHQHTDNTHADTLQQGAHGITVTSVFGAQDFMEGTGDSGSAPVSGSITISCQHQDLQDASGDHLVGNNYNAMISASTSWAGTVATPADTGWDVTGHQTATTNTGHITSQVNATKAMSLAAPVA